MNLKSELSRKRQAVLVRKSVIGHMLCTTNRADFAHSIQNTTPGCPRFEGNGNHDPLRDYSLFYADRA